MENKNLKTLLQTALLASLEAGEEIMRIYTDPKQDFGIERKADNSPLTLADKASHRVIMNYLDGPVRDAFPGVERGRAASAL